MAIIIIMAKKKRSLSQGFEEHELRENDSDNAHEERDGATQQKKGAKKQPKVKPQLSRKVKRVPANE